MEHLKLNITKEGLAYLEWNQKGSSLNLGSHSFIKELELVIKQLNVSQVKVLVCISTNKKSFCAGADIKELSNIKNSQTLKDQIKQANKVFSDFEKLNICKIAAIEGVCLGGGLEWALCFDYRLVSNSPQTQLGFPEVQLGLIPGAGGTLRLPKCVGLIQSLKMITTGKNISANKAYDIGLAYEKIPALLLKQRALDLAHQVLKGQLPTTPKNIYKRKRRYFYRLEFLFKQLICLIFKRQVLKKTKGFYPAPIKAIDLIKQTYSSSISHKTLNKNTSVFIALFETQVSKNLIRLFLMKDQAKQQLTKKLNTINSPQNKSIQKIAVLGAGVMGQSIAYLLIDKGFEVRLIDNNSATLCLAVKNISSLLSKKKQQDFYELKHKKSLLSVSQNHWGFKTFDLVIEALPENLNLKQEIITKISQQLNSDCLFATNTSSLSVSTLAKSSYQPENFFGLHFFNPAHKIPLIEVCLSPTQNWNHLLTFIKKINKIPLFVKDSPSFIVNRLLLSYLVENLILFDEGYSIQHLDRIFKKQGFLLGPFELMDKIGLDVCLQVLSNLEQANIILHKPEWVRSLTTVLGKGEKDNNGFYIYTKGKKSLNPSTKNLAQNNAIQKLSKKLNSKEIFHRSLNKMINSAEYLLENKIVNSSEEIDLAMVFGAGFPAFLGGPMQYKNSRSILKDYML